MTVVMYLKRQCQANFSKKISLFPLLSSSLSILSEVLSFVLPFKPLKSKPTCSSRRFEANTKLSIEKHLFLPPDGPAQPPNPPSHPPVSTSPQPTCTKAAEIGMRAQSQGVAVVQKQVPNLADVVLGS